jgi:hypothetical protein
MMTLPPRGDTLVPASGLARARNGPTVAETWETVYGTRNSTTPVRGLFLLFVAVLVVSSGCLDASKASVPTKTAAAAGGMVGTTKSGQPLVPLANLSALAQQVLVSPPGHRMAEYMITRNVVDPMNMVIATMDYDYSGTGTMQCSIFYSKDGGAGWAASSPIPGLDRPHLQFDPWVSFDRDGVAHLVCLDYSNGPSSVPWYTYSKDGGATWAQAVVVAPWANGCDKSSLHAGIDGRIYIACSGGIVRTDDMGKTWLPMVSSGGSNPNGFVEDSFGYLYLLTRSGVTMSKDRGDTWNRTVVGPFQAAPGYNDQNRWVRQEPWITLPTIAMNPVNENIVVAQQSWNAATSLFEISVYESTLPELNFTKVTAPVFTSESCSPCHVTKPSIAIDSRGVWGLMVQLVNDGGHTKEIMFSASGDGGQTWLAPIALSKTTTPNEWANPRAFRPDPEGATDLATYVAENPTDAGQVAVGLGLTTAVSELQIRWNGEYWGIHSSPEGFVLPWIDHSADGVPQLYTRLVGAD